MKFDPNDARWTAYAFDELSASERAAADVELQTNAGAQQFVAELRRTAEVLRAALKSETAPELGDKQRQAVLAVANNRPVPNDQIAAATLPTLNATEQRRTVMAHFHLSTAVPHVASGYG